MNFKTFSCGLCITFFILITVLGNSEASKKSAEIENNSNAKGKNAVTKRPTKIKVTELQYAQVVIERSNSTDNGTTEEHVETTTSKNVSKKPAAKKCVTGKVCFGDRDCAKGRCLGIAVGKCDCTACLNLVPCKNDKACGGLLGSCDKKTNYCNCFEGYKKNGFETFFDALNKFCGVKKCTQKSDSCFGLPCKPGFCVC
ncbi:unnamed protein product [Anisakis simplex]|uniref:Uncharacterized protein n=1 Tax=Anisakis simplex TaxID=6269 RepID=A0A0M3KE38_ANISI|nr:unnamed protein product [Anisakis simplex]